MNPFVYGELIFNDNDKTTEREKQQSFQQLVIGQLIICTDYGRDHADLKCACASLPCSSLPMGYSDFLIKQMSGEDSRL